MRNTLGRKTQAQIDQIAEEFGFQYDTELDGECILHLYAKGKSLSSRVFILDETKE